LVVGFFYRKNLFMDLIGLVAGIISSITWGTVFIFGKIAVEKGNCHPILLSFIRFLSASIFLAFSMFFTREKFKIEKREIFDFFILGATGILGMNVFIFYSVKFAPSSSTSILMNTNAFLIGIFGHFMLKEKVAVKEILGILVGFLGCYFIISQGSFSLHPFFLGNLLTFLAAICWAFYTVWGKKKKLIKKYGPISSTFWASVFGTILLGLTLLFFKIPFYREKIGLIIGIYLGIIPAGIGFTLWFFAIQRLKTITAGILQFLAPLTTVVIAVLWFNETLSSYTIIGGILILTGVIFPLLKFPDRKQFF